MSSSAAAHDPDPHVGPAVVAWADEHLRDLPWRRSRDPWAILVAETMLQQTQVSRVLDRWRGFVARFPDPVTTAAAPAADLVREWDGLGYNRRASMLHAAATQITVRHDGVVPDDLASLLALPGVGPYTARAVRAFAFEAEAAPVDTNIGRVLARLGGRSLGPAEAQHLADSLVPPGRSWAHNQGLMEIGALICTKRSPRCDGCPLARHCAWQGRGDDPATGSAAVGRPQSRFDGSDRQLRGRLVRALRVGVLPLADAATTMGCADPGRVERVVAGLVRDGLVERGADASGGGLIRLAGEELSPGR